MTQKSSLTVFSRYLLHFSGKSRIPYCLMNYFSFDGNKTHLYLGIRYNFSFHLFPSHLIILPVPGISKLYKVIVILSYNSSVKIVLAVLHTVPFATEDVSHFSTCALILPSPIFCLKIWCRMTLCKLYLPLILKSETLNLGRQSDWFDNNYSW